MQPIRVITAILAGLCVLGACSIKEGRRECPCWVEVYLSECRPHTDLVQMVWWEEGGRSSAAVAAVSDDIYLREMPRSRIGYSAWCGVSALTKATALALVIPEGEQADPVLSYSAELDARCESVRDTIRLRKQYCRVTMRFTEASLMGDPEATVTVKGHWNGWTLGDWDPLRGAFRCAADRISGLEWTVMVPRQGDDSLELEAFAPGVSGTLPLGVFLAAAGYDWGAYNLPDVVLDIDWVAWKIMITVQEWGNGFSREYLI